MKVLLPFATVLALAVSLQFRDGFTAEENHPSPDLRGVLSANPEGWIVEDLPIGDTEQLREVSQQTLRYDDYVFRRYRRGTVEFTAYIAYWRPGKHPPQMIAQHTPDTCWTLNGMTCEEMRFNVRQRLGSAELWPAQWRKFRTPNGQVIYTMFWHSVGDRPYDYGERFYSTPNPVTHWYESLRFAVGAKRPQIFFRITSNTPVEEIWEDQASKLS